MVSVCHELNNRLHLDSSYSLAKFTDTDIAFASAAIEGCLCYDLKEIGFYLHLSEQQIYNTISDKHSSRPKKIHDLIHSWTEENLENATIKSFNDLLQTKILATVQRWYNMYNPDDIKQEFMDKINRLNRFTFGISKALNSEEWKKFKTTLKMPDKNSSDIQKHLNFWIEKYGYEEATIENLKSYLKKKQLRHKIYEIETLSDVAYPCRKFCDFLECYWKDIFCKLPEAKRAAIFESLSQVGCNEDDAFNAVVKSGNDGFHNFLRVLWEEVEDLEQLFDDCEINLLKLKNIPVTTHFIPSDDYNTVKAYITENNMHIALYGNAYLGKNQCVLKIAEEFKLLHPFSIVWCFECDNETWFSDVRFLCQELVSGDFADDEMIPTLVRSILSSDFNVFLHFKKCTKNLEKSNYLNKLVHELRKCKKVFMIVTSNDETLFDITPFNKFTKYHCHGLSHLKGKEFLLNEHDDISHSEENAAMEIAKKTNGSSFWLTFYRYLCHSKNFHYTDILNMIIASNLQDFLDEWTYKNGLSSFKVLDKTIDESQMVQLASKSSTALDDIERQKEFKKLYHDFYNYQSTEKKRFLKYIHPLQEEMRRLKKEIKFFEKKTEDLECQLKAEKEEQVSYITKQKDIILQVQEKDEEILRLKDELKEARNQSELKDQKIQRMEVQRNDYLKEAQEILRLKDELKEARNQLELKDQKIRRMEVQRNDYLKEAQEFNAKLLEKEEEIENFKRITCIDNDVNSFEQLEQALNEILPLKDKVCTIEKKLSDS